MRRILRQLHDPRDERVAMLTDAVGAIALFVLLAAALYMPLIA
ncbi:hypothetical protein [Pararhodobacter zhoushanensis]|nr:hypothetical protein [Pararhodobacter zhoushanensis]